MPSLVHALLPCAFLGLAACSAESASFREQDLASLEGENQGPASSPEGTSVVIASHLYSLYDPGRTPSRRPALVWPGALEAFAQELERIDPAQVFFLGDNTRNGREEEWQLLERAFAPLGERVQYGAGNHDLSQLEAFEAHGGVRMASKRVGNSKFIQLDCEKVLGESSLAFLKAELADAEAHEHVFLLMHYFLAGWKELEEGQDLADAQGGQDPNATARLTNWQRDVVPLIAGKVDAVFVGDYRHDHVRSMVQHHEGKPIRYVLNSFGFGFDAGVGEGSDGPMVFLELRLEGDSFRILPRSVPLDLRHGYFGFAPRTELRPLRQDWAQVDYEDPGAGVAFRLAYGWKVVRGPSIEVEATTPDPTGEGQLEFSVSSIAMAGDDDVARRAGSATWLARIAPASEGLSVSHQRSLPVDGRLGLWAKVEGQRDAEPLTRWSQVIVHLGRAWVFTLTVPGPPKEAYLQLWNHLMSGVQLTP